MSGGARAYSEQRRTTLVLLLPVLPLLLTLQLCRSPPVEADEEGPHISRARRHWRERRRSDRLRPGGHCEWALSWVRYRPWRCQKGCAGAIGDDANPSLRRDASADGAGSPERHRAGSQSAARRDVSKSAHACTSRRGVSMGHRTQRALDTI